MGNYVLTLHYARCPDGAEFEPHPWVSGSVLRIPEGSTDKDWPVVRFRSERREDYRLRLEAPDKLMVTEFLNTVPWDNKDADPDTVDIDFAPMLEFISEYGFPLNLVNTGELVKELTSSPALRSHLADAKWSGVTVPDSEGKREYIVELPEACDRASRRMEKIPLHPLIEIQRCIRHIWNAYETGTIPDAVDAFRRQVDDTFASLTPSLELRGGSPVLTLPVSSPFAFMLMETALVITGGSQVMRCAKCGTIFVTGSGTGRRGSSLYCSNRCRVAAQRSRTSTPTSSAEDVMTDEEKLEKIAAGVRGTPRE